MKINLLTLIVAFITLSAQFSYGQNENTSKIQEVTFIGKVKFNNIFTAGQPRNSLRACNGTECKINGYGFSSYQKLIYKKAKILTIGNCVLEMTINSDKLLKYQVTTSGEKETKRLRFETQKELGKPKTENGMYSWTTKNQYDEIITSQLSISKDQLTGDFISWIE